MKSIKVILILLVGILTTKTYSQEVEPGNWLMYFGQYKVQPKLSIHGEIQHRNHTVQPDLEQLLIRTGLNYHFQSNAFVTGGYAYISSHPYQQDTSIVEHRIWQQLIATQKLGPVKLEHRYRVEQRWVEGDYRNRLRYRLMAFIPVHKQIGEKGNVFIGLYDEIFMNTEQVYFDRNRAYAAVGYQINKGSNVQVGVLNQAINPFDKWYLQVAFINNIDFSNR